MQSSTTTIALRANYIKQRLEQLIWKQENPLGEEKEDSLSRERETHDFAKYYYFSMEMRSIKMNVRNVTPLVHTLLPFEYHKKACYTASLIVALYTISGSDSLILSRITNTVPCN